MTKFIPIFPLNIVIFPNEAINLHIFEPRYKQLIADCVNQQTNFAIGTILKNELQEFACEVHITEITKTYDNGEMDIRIKGISVCRVLQLIDAVPDKMYNGAIVNYPENILNASYAHKLQKVKSKLDIVFKTMNIAKIIKANNDAWSSYDFGHYCGLSLEQEYDFLSLLNEDQRLDYILYYLQQMQTNSWQSTILTNKVMLNGHFRLNK